MRLDWGKSLLQVRINVQDNAQLAVCKFLVTGLIACIQQTVLKVTPLP